jgi:hypothetical protein
VKVEVASEDWPTKRSITDAETVQPGPIGGLKIMA